MIVGLTGGIASGKTFCSDYLTAKYTVLVTDADLLAREVVAPGSIGLERICHEFGHEILNQDGSLNRGEMRLRIFADMQMRLRLNAIIHPLVRSLILQRIQENAIAGVYQILSVPLLLENGLQCYTDTIVLVDIKQELQIQRLSKRDHTDKTLIQQMLAAQLSRPERLRQINFVIDNNHSKSHTEIQLDNLHKRLSLLAS